MVRDTLGNINSRDIKYHPLKECKAGTNSAHYLHPIGEAAKVVGRKRRE